jgi:hypothetical protein
MLVRHAVARGLLVGFVTIGALSFTALVVAGTGSDKDKLPGSLEKMIAAAMTANPEIVLAVAKVRQAEAELNETRLRVTREVTKIDAMRRKQRVVINTLRQSYDEKAKLRDQGMVSEAVLAGLVNQFAEAEGRLSEIEAEARYLLGLGGDRTTALATGDGRKQRSPISKRIRPRMPESTQALLDLPVPVRFSGTPLPQVFVTLRRATGDRAAFVYRDEDLEADAAKREVNLDLPEGTTLGQALLAIHDRCNVVFIFRGYGFLIADADVAKYVSGPAIPPDTPLSVTD